MVALSCITIKIKGEYSLEAEGHNPDFISHSSPDIPTIKS